MTVTASEAESLIARAQTESAYQFYVDNPEYLEATSWCKARTLEEVRADLDEDGDEGPDWGEGIRDAVTVDGHVVSHVESFGGEGQGDTLYEVYKIDDQLFRKDGYWVSHDGSYWDGDFAEVEAYVEPVTKYRSVK